ncbi:unnamed protein product, partial [Mesorhabditis spiculigera]
MVEKDEAKDLYDDIQLTGLKYLKEKNVAVRCIWGAVVVLFIALTIYQIQSQLADFLEYPVVTNIEAEYPEKIFFPAIAICNNNQYSLGYLATEDILERYPEERDIEFGWPLFKTNKNNFEFSAIVSLWDMPADKFLREALPPLKATILSCHLPNGTECNPKMWKLIWTINGLCWAFNNARDDRLVIEQPGLSQGLKLVLNAESYDRPLTCGVPGNMQAENGFKVLVYNQTEIPVSTASGISVAPGQSTNIPLKIVHRTKLPGTGCRVQTQESLDAANDYFNGNNIRSCHGRIYHEEFERSCNCTFRHLYTGLEVIPEGDICDVEQYFTCILYVQKNIAALTENRTKTECIPTCEQVEFLAQQDTSELPKNLMSSMIFDKRITTIQQRLVGVGPDGKRIFKEEPVDCEKSGFLTTEQEWVPHGWDDERLNGTQGRAFLLTNLSAVVNWRDLKSLELFEQGYDNWWLGESTKDQFALLVDAVNLDYLFDNKFPKHWRQPIDKLLDDAWTALLHDIDAIGDAMQEAHSNNDSLLTNGTLDEVAAKNQDCIVKLISAFDNLRAGLEYNYLDYLKSFHVAFSDHLKRYHNKFKLDDEFKKQNMAIVNIYIRSNTIEKWTQKWQYTFWSLACDVGGALGLFIGVSVASLLEIFYVLYRHLQQRKRRKQCSGIFK